MRLYRKISGVIAGLSLLVAGMTSCQEEIQSEGQAVLAENPVLTFEAQNAAEQIISLKADGKWVAEVSVDWLTVDPMSGEGHADVKVTVADNVRNGAPDEPRSGTIRFSAVDGRNYGYLSYATCSVTVNQKGDNYLLVAEETTVTDTAALWDSEPAKVKDAQVMAVADNGFVISDGTTNLFVESAAEVKVGDKLFLNGTKTTVNALPSFIGDEVTVLSNSEVVYPKSEDITLDLDSYKAEKVGLVTVSGTLVGNSLLGIMGSPSKGVTVLDATRTMGLDAVAVHSLEVTGYWLGFNGTAHVIAVASFEDKGENPEICAEFPYRDDFSWLQPFVEDSKLLVSQSKWPIDAVGQNVNTGTNLPNLYTDIPLCLEEFKARGYADYMPEYKSIFLADGYLKFSISKKPTGIVLPLIGISGKEDIYVQFDWCAEKNGSGVIDGVNIVVEIDGPGTFETPSKDNPKVSASLATTQVAEQLAWQKASVRINGATMATKISIRPVETSGMRRWFLDNLAVVSLKDAVPANIDIEGPQDDIFKFEGTPEGPQSFVVMSDKDFFVTPSANWVKVDVTEGAAYEKTTVNVTCEETTLSTLREAYITVSSGSTTYKLIVIQSAAGSELAPFISVVGGNSVNIDEFANDVNVQIQANVDFQYEITEGAEWLSAVETPATRALVEVVPVSFKALANDKSKDRIAKIRFFNEKEGLETILTVIQKKLIAYQTLAMWDLSPATAEQHNLTFNTTGKEEGFGGAYVAASVGNAKIEYYQVDKTMFTDVKDENVYRKLNDDNHMVAKGNWTGDYFLFTASREGDAVIPAGTEFEISFATRISSAGPALWIAEFLDGGEWKAAGPVETKLVNDAQVEYNISHSNTSDYPRQFIFKSTADMSKFQFRVRCVATWRYSGNIDAKPSGGNTRINGGDQAPRIRALYND